MGAPDWEALRRSMAGELVLPDGPAFEELRKPFNARFHHVRPRAVARCASPEDVAEALAFAGRHDIGFGVRSGGHCLAGRSSSMGLVLDVSSMNAVEVANGLATVGAGARLGDVYASLDESGLAIPAGTCPSVGVAGLTLGGGLGILGRRHGVTSDHLVAAEIVLADGRVVACDEHDHGDLFWALRGAGAGTLGVVTALTFRPVPAPEVTSFRASWPFARAASVVDAWQRWAPDGPDELAASLKVTAPPDVDGAESVDVYGAFQGSASEAAVLLQELVEEVGAGPVAAWSEFMSFAETRAWWAHLGAEEPAAGEPPEQPWLVAKSEFFRSPLPAEGVVALLDAFVEERRAGEFRELDFMPWGGAYNRVPSRATAFVHREERFLLKHAAVVDPEASAGVREAASGWVRRSWGSVHPWGTGRVFQNFPDPDLEDWSEAYYGENLGRLLRTKARYDPTGVFRFQRAVPDD